MHRFFLPSSSFTPPVVVFPREVTRQINLVLRLRPGAEVIALDGTGMEYRVRLTEVASDSCSGEIITQAASEAEPLTKLTLLLCLTQREKFEWILQKCTEIGVSVFVPVISSRSLVQSPREIEGKLERWQRILSEAGEQSHRGIVPDLRPVLRFEEAIRLPELRESCCLIPWEEEKGVGLRTTLLEKPSTEVALLIGPEGGFSEAEVVSAKSAGFIPVTLGPRILRMETAAMAAAALVLYERGDMEMRSDQAAR